MANTLITINQIRNEALAVLDMEFDREYGKWALNKLQLVYIRRGRYEIHKFDKRVAKNIKHRREALALMKLMNATQE
jgi:hypothetical protein